MNYETILVFRQDISTTQVETLADKYQKILTDNNSEILRREYWGLKNLAYIMKKNKKGHFLLINFTANNDSLVEFKRQIGLSEDIIRHMTIKIKETPKESSIMMNSKQR